VICHGLLFVQVEVRGDFSDIGVIVDHHCLNFFFIMAALEISYLAET
jgi:hypothetical protein